MVGKERPGVEMGDNFDYKTALFQRPLGKKNRKEELRNAVEVASTKGDGRKGERELQTK